MPFDPYALQYKQSTRADRAAQRNQQQEHTTKNNNKNLPPKSPRGKAKRPQPTESEEGADKKQPATKKSSRKSTPPTPESSPTRILPLRAAARKPPQNSPPNIDPPHLSPPSSPNTKKHHPSRVCIANLENSVFPFRAMTCTWPHCDWCQKISEEY
jgi:hypothetical protein